MLDYDLQSFENFYVNRKWINIYKIEIIQNLKTQFRKYLYYSSSLSNA